MWPAGVPDRRRRPRIKAQGGGTLLGALLGGILTENPAGAALGGAVGHLVETAIPMPLDQALTQELAARGYELVTLQRRGPRSAKLLFGRNASYSTVSSTAPIELQTNTVDVDDWLFGDLVDVQLQSHEDHLNFGL